MTPLEQLAEFKKKMIDEIEEIADNWQGDPFLIEPVAAPPMSKEELDYNDIDPEESEVDHYDGSR